MSSILLATAFILAYAAYGWPDGEWWVWVPLFVLAGLCFSIVGYRIDSAYLRSKARR